jgi:hypothetical protein
VLLAASFALRASSRATVLVASSGARQAVRFESLFCDPCCPLRMMTGEPVEYADEYQPLTWSECFRNAEKYL